MDLEQLLNRRSDLSTFLVHLTRAAPPTSALQNLTTILQGGCIEARNALGAAKEQTLQAGSPIQSVVCFSETPLEHIWTLCENIAGRNIKMEPYGVAFTKAFGRRKGINPVWYTDITPGHDWPMKSLNKLVEEAAKHEVGHISHEILRISPFVEQMGPTNAGTKKEFWWEREWRCVGDFTFRVSSVMAVLAPEEEHRTVEGVLAGGKSRVPPIVDPRWSPERMLATLSGLVTDAGAIPDGDEL